MKTIFFGITQGFGARYLLRTHILKNILNEDTIQAVILTPNSDEQYFRNEFSSCRIYQFHTEKCKIYYDNSRIRSFFLHIRKNVLNSKERIPFIDDKFNIWSDKNKLDSARSVWVRKKLSHLLRSYRCLRKLLIKVESFFWKGHFHKDVFLKYRPDLTIVCSNGFFLPEALLLREAQYHGSKTMSVILSWDNTTSKGYGGAFPDYFLTWTNTMRQELVEYHDISPDKIIEAGIAHFDVYYRAKESRFTFCRKLGLDPNRKIILFATKSPRPFPNADIALLLAESITNGDIQIPCQLLIRLHPNYFALGKRNDINKILKIREKYSHVTINQPKILSSKLAYDMPNTEMEELSNIIHNSDVMINMFSTMVIEAAICDIPIINVCFNGCYNEYKSYYRDIKFDRKQIHNQRIEKTGGTIIAENRKQLIYGINKYLICPELHRKERRHIVTNEAGPNRGIAGKTIAKYIKNILNTH
jgi:hypothetical protein